MASDNRKKGCPNTECVRNKKEYYYKATDQFCTICGQPLVYVCKSCFSRIDDIDKKHIRCVQCEAKIADRKAKIANKRNAAVGGVAAAGVGILKVAKNEVVKQGGDLAKNAVKAGFAVAAKMIKK